MPDRLDIQALILFEKLLESSESERAQIIATECGDDDALRETVEKMLVAHSGAEEHESARDGSTEIVDRQFTVDDTIADRYIIRELAGIGGMGHVWRATDMRLDRDVAIKVLSPELMASASMHQRFEREMKSVATLSHPNVMAIHDICDDGSRTFAVMEFLRGTTVRELLADGVDVTTAVRIAEGIANGLSAAHEQEIMHRDVKPENVMVLRDRTVRILDFGLARLEQPTADLKLSGTHVAIGTVPYMSPEQAENRPLTCATDLFSLGTVLYEMLTGSNPFEGDGILDTLQRVSHADPPPIAADNVPLELRTLIQQLFSKNPEHRPSAAVTGNVLRNITHDSRATPFPTHNTSQVDAGQGNPHKSDWHPSLIVVPFQVLSGHDELEAMADSLVEDLATVLTRIPMIRLTSRMSSHSVKGKDLSAGEIRRRFSVDYMIEGRLQRRGHNLGVNIQLVETRNQSTLWAQQFDCPEDLDASNTLLSQIVARLEPRIIRAVVDDQENSSSESDSRQLVFQAMTALSLKGWSNATFTESAELLWRAIALEPDYALSHAYLALIRGLGQRVGLVHDPDSAITDVIEHSEKALDLNDMDSNVLGLTGCALSDVGETDRAIPLLQQSIELNPNNAQAYAGLGTAMLTQDKYAEAAFNLKKGIELSPSDSRLAVWNATLALTYLLQQEVDAALEAATNGCRADRKSYLPRVVLIAVHLVQNDRAAAERALGDTRRAKPDLSDEEINGMLGRRLGAVVRRFIRERW